MISLQVALVVAICIFASAVLGLLLQTRLPRSHLADDSRDVVKLITGLVGTLSALVLGLLVASASASFATQRAGLEMLSSRILQLDRAMRHFGPATEPARSLLKSAVTESYEEIWLGAHGRDVALSVARPDGKLDAFSAILAGLEPQTDAQRRSLARMIDIGTSLVDARQLMALQIRTPVAWPLVAILTSWVSLLFFGFGLLAHRNATVVVALGIGALAVASAVFLIIDLTRPYSGLLRLSPAPLLQVLDALGR